jgi:hypothetical protein
VARGLARSWSDFAGAQLLGGNPDRARSAAWQSLATRPHQLLAWKVLTKSLARSLWPR